MKTGHSNHLLSTIKKSIDLITNQLNSFIQPAPGTFDGTFSVFFDRHVACNLPSPKRVAAFDKSLRSYLAKADPIHLIRWVNPKASPQERGTIYTTENGRLRPSDNAPVWWLHAFLLSENPVPSVTEFERLMEKIPCHFHQMGRFQTLNQAGYHAAHIVNAKNGNTNWERWDRNELARRTLANIHPCNMFLTAKKGWPRNGGRPEIISWVASSYVQRFGDVMEQFLEDAAEVAVAPTSKPQTKDDPRYRYGYDGPNQSGGLEERPPGQGLPQPSSKTKLSQRDFMREAYKEYGAEIDLLARAYENAEKRGHVSRKSNGSKLDAYEYGIALANDGIKKGWIYC